jgi:energy-coupling factor transporter transmembrane protein EcfT
MPFLEYSKKNTFMHKAHPITKIMFLLTFLIIAGLYWDFRYLLPFLLTSITLYVAVKVPKSWIKYIVSILLISTPTTGWIALFQTNPSLYKVYPPEFVSQKIFTCNLPLVGTIGLTCGSLLWLCGFVIKWAITLLVVSIFTYTTSPIEIAHLFAQIKSLVPLSYVFMVTMRFIPTLQRILGEVISIQSLRGWSSPGRNVSKYPRMLKPIMQPFVARTFLQVEEVSIAAQMRGFGSGKVTMYRANKLTFAEIIILLIFTSTLILAITGLLLYNIGLL